MHVAFIFKLATSYRVLHPFFEPGAHSDPVSIEGLVQVFPNKSGHLLG